MERKRKRDGGRCRGDIFICGNTERPGLFQTFIAINGELKGAESFAMACADINPNKAYILGLLHDIGGKFGVRRLGHVFDGYTYMISLEYDGVARVCPAHSFNNQTIDEYMGKFDTTDEELEIIQNALKSVAMDDYERLIRLCDCLAGVDSVLDVEDRMKGVRRRYGFYPREKWAGNLALKKYF